MRKRVDQRDLGREGRIEEMTETEAVGFDHGSDGSRIASEIHERKPCGRPRLPGFHWVGCSRGGEHIGSRRGGRGALNSIQPLFFREQNSLPDCGRGSRLAVLPSVHRGERDPEKLGQAGLSQTEASPERPKPRGSIKRSFPASFAACTRSVMPITSVHATNLDRSRGDVKCYITH